MYTTVMDGDLPSKQDTKMEWQSYLRPSNPGQTAQANAAQDTRALGYLFWIPFVILAIIFGIASIGGPDSQLFLLFLWPLVLLTLISGVSYFVSLAKISLAKESSSKQKRAGMLLLLLLIVVAAAIAIDLHYSSIVPTTSY